MSRRGILTLAVLAVGALVVVLVVMLNRPEAGPSQEPEPRTVIALDAGHGGRDPGAEVDGLLEKDVNLELVLALRDLIEAETDLEVVLTRSLDIFVLLEDRIRRAEEAGAVMYVSIHVNSYIDPQPDGIETIVDDTRPLDDASYVLAELIQDNVTQATGARDRGTRDQESYLERTAMPAVSVEVGYLTNPDERARLTDPAYQQLLVRGILQGILQFLDWSRGEDG